MTIDEQIKILDAYKRGEEIEYRMKHVSDWSILLPLEYYIRLEGEEHQFDFHTYEYRIKGKIWRAKEDGTYYFVDESIDVWESSDTYCDIDNNRYKAGNYFRTREEAQKANDLIKETLTKFHEDNK